MSTARLDGASWTSRDLYRSISNMQRPRIPTNVIAAASNALVERYSRTQLSSLFELAGATGDEPMGNKTDMCKAWLRRCNDDPAVKDPFHVIGRLLEEYMEEQLPDDSILDWVVERRKLREALQRALREGGLSYVSGGIIAAAAGTATKTLDDLLREHPFETVETEFRRGVQFAKTDPPAALTAARAIVEATFKLIVAERGLTPPKNRAEIGGWWKVVREDLGLDASKHADEDVRIIINAMSAIVEGVAALRTHEGSAHGAEPRKRYRLEPRHAHLAVNAAHTLVLFLLETWKARAAAKV